MGSEASPATRTQPRLKGGRPVNWGLAILAAVTTALALPFVGFVIFATV